MAEKTLREAAEVLAKIEVTEERGIDGRLYRRYYHLSELEMHDLRAALANTQGEDREADRPDAEKALEELVDYLDIRYAYDDDWTYKVAADVAPTPHFTDWLKSRERGA